MDDSRAEHAVELFVAGGLHHFGGKPGHSAHLRMDPFLYSKVSSNEVANGNGEWHKIATSAIGVGTTTFIPPEVGYTYWVRIVARKDANSYMYSDEIASFTLPAITLDRATWKKGSSAAEDEE